MKKLSIMTLLSIAIVLVFTGCGAGSTTQTISMGGDSMLPTLQDGTRITIDKAAYASAEPQRGDIILFMEPAGKIMVKRVIGLPGDELAVRDGSVYINGAELAEPYLFAPKKSGQDETWKVPEKCVFVLGDNRQNSRDSRQYGPIPYEKIGGKVILNTKP